MKRISLLTAAALVGCAGLAHGQAFTRNTGVIPSGAPGNNSVTENVDFADVDLDGDWDAAFADGGDNGNDQNRIWINQGPSFTGVFVDETASRFPTIQDDSRDIEFVDFDNDGDQDLYISNTAQIVNQSNRWWRNTGVGDGVYVDESTTRWIDIGTNGSSVANSLVIPTGFIDWSCDCDFGDLDNDGDMDLVHSSYGGAFGGQVPTRLYLNDGAGNFKEFNPSGFLLPGTQISNGNPALWASGMQQANTGEVDGSEADIATSTLDIDLGDLDGDFDLDILHGARDERPRIFINNLEENGGALTFFRDAGGNNSAASQNAGALLPVFSHGNGNYEQEMGDFDGDGDLDLYGLNWIGFTDIVSRNDGTGRFAVFTTLSGSGADDNEGDFFDYDNDGDLDIVVGNFSGQDKLYRNNGGGSYTNVTGAEMPNNFTITLDIDCCDVDNDGDYDMFSANDNGAPNWYYENLTQIPDTTAPYIPNVEQVPDATTSQAVVRAHVYDNAPYYITWYNNTWMEVSDGGPVMIIPMRSSGGQIFRGEIPAGLSGTVTYQVFSEDEYGNQGASALMSFDAGGSAINVYCTAKTSSAGCVAQISTTNPGAQPVSGANGYSVTATDVQGFKNGLLFAGINGAAALPFNGGTLCMNGPLKRGPITGSGGNSPVNCSGTYSTEVNDGAIIPAGLDAGMGNSAWYQYWYRDPNNGAGNFGTALSNAVQLDFQ